MSLLFGQCFEKHLTKFLTFFDTIFKQIQSKSKTFYEFCLNCNVPPFGTLPDN